MSEGYQKNTEITSEDKSYRDRKRSLRLLIVGAGKVGARVFLQLRKNPDLCVVTMDPRDNPFAVEEGIIPFVDYKRELNPGELEAVIAEVKPDLVLVTTSREDIGRSGVPGLEILVEALKQELEATAKVPIIAVSRTGLN